MFTSEVLLHVVNFVESVVFFDCKAAAYTVVTSPLGATYKFFYLFIFQVFVEQCYIVLAVY